MDSQEISGNDSTISESIIRQKSPVIGEPQDDIPITAIRSGTVEIVDNKAVFKPSREFYLAFMTLGVISFAVAFETTSLGVALPIISAALGGTALEAFWSGTSFLLASTVLQPTVASLSNIFGRKYMLYVVCALFAAGSLIGALAKDFTVLLIGRTVQGVGGGGLIALTEVIITDLLPLAFRGQWFSMLNAVMAVGTVAGPMIGAGFAQNVHWTWIFWINLPIIGLGIVCVFLFLNQAKIPGHLLQKLGRFDWIGSILFTASATSFLFGLTTGGVLYDWSSWRVLLPIIIGPFGLVAFGFYEIRVASEPIIHRGIFKNRDLILTYVTTVMHAAILWSLIYFLILYYQGVKFYSAINSAVATLPETLTVAPAGAVVGIVAGISGRYRPALWIGWVLTTLGAGLLLLLEPQTTVAQWIFLNIPIGIGTGMLFPAMGLSIQAASEPALNGQAAAFFSFLRTFGQSIGVAISGVIFQNVFQQKLSAIPAFAPLAGQYSRDATIVVGIIQHMTPSIERDQLVQAYNDSLRTIYVALTAFAGFSLVLSVFIRGYSLNQEHITQQALLKTGPGNIVTEKSERDAEAAS